MDFDEYEGATYLPDPDAARAAVQKALHNNGKLSFGLNPAIAEARTRLAAFAPIASPVLITGERGSGCAAAARALHAAVECTDANARFAVLQAETLRELPAPSPGTMYLRDAEKLSPELQKAWPDFASAHKKAPARWIVSAACILEAAQFQPDFANWCGRFCVALPALREHPEDIPRIARRMAETFSARAATRRSFSTTAMKRLCAHDWPGNTAELSHAVEQLVLCAGGGLITAAAVNKFLDESAAGGISGLRAAAAHDEREKLLAALQHADGNIARCAKLLEVNNGKVYRMLKRHNIPLK